MVSKFIRSITATNLKSNNGWFPAILLTELIQLSGTYKIYFMYTSGFYTLDYNNLDIYKNEHYVIYFNNYDINSVLYDFKIVKYKSINKFIIQLKQQLIKDQFKLI